MTPKEITTLAGHRLVPFWVMKLALDVAAAEREACAKLCEDIQEVWLGEPVPKRPGYECAAAIRQRGEK